MVLSVSYTRYYILWLTLISNVSFGQLFWERDIINPVVMGSSDEILNIADPSVIYDGERFQMWMGCVGVDPTFASTCYSESIDGSSWSDPIIVFSPSTLPESWDNQKTEVPAVILDTLDDDASRLYKMWYGGANSLDPDETKIGLAYSPDGIDWTRLQASESPHGEEGLVLIPGFEIGDAGVVSDPTVIRKAGVFHMWYNSFGSTNDILISHATSADGASWNKDANNPVLVPTEAWEQFGPGEISMDVVQPVVLIDPNSGDFLMSYGSFDSTDFEVYDGFGFAMSADGSNWEKDPTNPTFTPDISQPGEQIGIHANSIVFVDEVFHMFYGGVNNLAVRSILHATAANVITAVSDELTFTTSNFYPNPSSNSATLKFLNPNGKPHDLEILNLAGKIVWQKTGIRSNRQFIDLSSLDQGLFFYRLWSNGRLRVSGKFLVEP